MKKNNAIQMKNINKSFDGFQALTDVSFTVKWGEVHALLGENGAGKSTLMNIVSGLYGPESGLYYIDDNPVTLSGPLDASRFGIGMVHQHFKLVESFTVTENTILNLGKRLSSVSFNKKVQETAEKIKAKGLELGFNINPNARINEISIAEQQRVEIIKVLVGGAKILILDEPTAVLTDEESESLLDKMRDFARKGNAVILVTHKMKDVFRYADRVTVMRKGETVKTLLLSEVNTTELVSLTVGNTVVQDILRNKVPPGKILLNVDNLSTVSINGKKNLNNICFNLRKGEIFGIAGVGGNGQSELAAVLMGHTLKSNGTVDYCNENLLTMTHASRREKAVACIPSDRYKSALAAPLSITDNYALGKIFSGHYGPIWMLKKNKIKKETAEAVQKFDVQGVHSLSQKTALLSGGNAQKLVISREFDAPPSLLIVHSPSRGLDVKASMAVRKKIMDARNNGAAVLLISEDLDEVISLSDRIGVMCDGKIVEEFNQPADRQKIGQAMVNHV
jgi:simple sugar transport system ATP-binding protein